MAKKKTKEVKKPKPKEEHFMDGLNMNFEEILKKITKSENAPLNQVDKIKKT